jgi:1-acyl-sn-glycerol-3-phosphate acyltransferase
LAPKEALRSLDQAAEAAKEGDLIIISPEGETHTQLTVAKRGVARLAKSERPFIPVAFTEEQSEEGFSHHVLIGTPIEPPEEANSWSDLPSQKRKVLEQGFADLLMSSIAELMPEDQRGKYK